ncbi:protein MENT isoform X1 [Sciurus carolinensis]|uniref:protein MENT isoform X1 n=1 Tax=Sciurus carolinensis TaxID=30640 RepID=UPI001FB2A30C|nr:protein MENT isoform X1 [Sciurus carolinensis]
MVPAACVLFWALLLSLGPRAAGTQDQTPTSIPTGTQGVTLRFGGPARSRNTGGTSQSSVPRKTKIILEDENDAVATADRLAGPAAAELLATVTGMSRSSEAGFGEDEDGSLEEGVVIDARKNNTNEGTRTITPNTVGGSSTGRFIANKQESEIRLTTSLPPATSRSTGDVVNTEASLNRWSTAGSTPSGWPSTSRTAMPPPEDLRLVLMPWGPWHCHCKSGTMSRTRSGKLQGISGRLRVGALRQIRTEHRPCTYQKCPCNRLREECPLDSDLCSDSSCTTTQTTTTSPMPPIQLRRRPLPPPPSPSPALIFWKKVRMGLEDIWNSLSSVFTEMQPDLCMLPRLVSNSWAQVILPPQPPE